MATRLKNMIKSAAEKLKSVSVWAKTAFVLWLLGGAVAAFAAYRFIYQHNFLHQVVQRLLLVPPSGRHTP